MSVRDGDRTDAVRRLVAAHAPELGGRHVRRLGDGADHEAYLVDDRVVVRLTKETDPGWAAARTARDAELLRTVAALSPVPVPRPVLVTEHEGLLAYCLLPGVPLVDVLYGERRVDAAPGSAAVAGTLGAVLRSLHAAPHERVAGLVDVEELTLADWLAEGREHYAVVRDAIPVACRGPVELWLTHEPPPDGDAPAFSHNDLGAEHVLVDPRTFTVTGVIDWSDAAVVDRARDFGLLLRDLGPRGLELALDAYGEVDDALRRRAWFFARCSVLEDLAFGLESGRDIYVRKSLIALTWLFAALSAA